MIAAQPGFPALVNTFHIAATITNRMMQENSIAPMPIPAPTAAALPSSIWPPLEWLKTGASLSDFFAERSARPNIFAGGRARRRRGLHRTIVRYTTTLVDKETDERAVRRRTLAL